MYMDFQLFACSNFTKLLCFVVHGDKHFERAVCCEGYEENENSICVSKYWELFRYIAILKCYN